MVVPVEEQEKRACETYCMIDKNNFSPLHTIYLPEKGDFKYALSVHA
jgi:hypothetical protein